MPGPFPIRRRISGPWVVLLFGTALSTHGLAYQLRQVPTPSEQGPILRTQTELVALNVTVSNERGHVVTGLKREDFKVYENDVEQPVSFFTAEAVPASWGVVLDRSGSMREMVRDVYQAAIHTIEEGTADDEMFLVAFNREIELLSDYTSDRHRLENGLLGLRAEGETALWDATQFAVEHARLGQHRKKVLMVITDGEDNASRMPFRELIGRVEEAPVVIYTVGMFESGGMLDSLLRRDSRSARNELQLLAERTGGRAHFPTNIAECREAMKEIAREVKHQYSIGYYPSDTVHDGRWRAIRIVVTRQDGKKHAARTRAGYYAPRSAATAR